MGGTGSKVKDTTHVEVADIAARNAYPVGKRKWGMRITVIGGLTYYLFRGLSSTNKDDNLNWVSEALYMAAIGVGGGGATNTWQYQGNWDASGGLFPGDANTKQYYTWKITVSGVFPDGNQYASGTIAIALIDNPGQTAANWKMIGVPSEWVNIVNSQANSKRRTVELLWYDGTAQAGQSDKDLFATLVDAVITVTFEVLGIKSDGSEIYTCTKKASFKKDGAAAPLLIGAVKTIDEVVEDGAEAPFTTVSINAGNVRIAFSSGATSLDVYRWTIFAKVSQTQL